MNKGIGNERDIPNMLLRNRQITYIMMFPDVTNLIYLLGPKTEIGFENVVFNCFVLNTGGKRFIRLISKRTDRRIRKNQNV